MIKRILSFLACLLLVLSATLPAAAKTREEEKETETVERSCTVSDLKDFLTLAENCRLDSYSQGLRVILRADIDLTGAEFTGIPIFSGIFEGNGHTIRGLRMTVEGSNQGLFRYLTENARVKDLHVVGTVQSTGSRSRIGGFAGSNGGKITGCSFTGAVSGNEYVGGFAGINEISGVLENCTMNGKVYGSHFVGGIAGKNSGVIRSCENKAQVNDTAQQNLVELSDITLDGLFSTESANTVTDIGGIAGSSIGVIRDCVNRGDVGYQHMGYNIGGIAGTQSGALLDSKNYGRIQGRKEVGGIVGQMEPTALIEYEEDALQILQRQLDGMAGVVSKTVSNVQSAGNALSGQVGSLQQHVWDAQNAVGSLIPDAENPQLPDMDAIQAAQNTLSSSMSGMTQTLRGMSATTESVMGQLSNNLHSLQSQINAMRTTLGNVSETLGGSITDVSDKDTESDLTGKTAGCVNYGTVLADRNAGGITGAMALENDLDHEENWSMDGENSLNFESELRAVIVNCENTATVTCKKENGGGIVGWQSMGLVKDSRNTGTLEAEGAEHVGGITGQSLGYIRACSAKCEISGGSFTGGIAGSSPVVTDSRSMVHFTASGEKLGAILGDREENRMEVENPIAGNLYLSVNGEVGGIDGISYAGQAESLDRASFLALENLPEMFKTVTVRFRYGNGSDRVFTVPVGGELQESWIPPIPPKAGYAASWESLEETDLTEVVFDLSFVPAYVGQDLVLQSRTQQSGRPVLLIQGSFHENAELTEKPIDTSALPEYSLEGWTFSVSGAEQLTAARILVPQDTDGNDVQVLVLSRDTWRETEASVDGSYLVVPLATGDRGIALVRKHREYGIVLISAGAVVLLGLSAWILRRKEKKTK